MVVAEIGLSGPGRDDQVVVGGHDGLAQLLCDDEPAGEVDPAHLSQQHGRVGLVAQDVPGRRRDLAGGEDAGGDLVQQRLEQVGHRLRDQGDVDVRLGEGLGREQAAEAGADDHYSWTGHV